MAKKDKGVLMGDPVTYQTPSPADGVVLETFIPWMLVKRGVRRQIITPLDAPEEFREEARVEQSVQEVVQHSPLMRTLGLAHYWQRLLDEGRLNTLGEIAVAEGIDRGRVSRIALLTQLAPDIVEVCISDKPRGLTLERLTRQSIPQDWSAQLNVL